MENKLHNIKTYKIITILSIIVIFFIIAYIPIHRANAIKVSLYKTRYNQIQYLNSKSEIIPEIINMIKGYIIHNEKALKNIVYINMLTKTKNNNIKDAYNNQIKIFYITNELMTNANKNSLLSNNEKFKNLKLKFDDIYLNIQRQSETCKIKTNQLQQYTNLPIYNRLIDISNIDDIICIN